jgi:hypothetical protein
MRLGRCQAKEGRHGKARSLPAQINAGTAADIVAVVRTAGKTSARERAGSNAAARMRSGGAL